MASRVPKSHPTRARIPLGYGDDPRLGACRRGRTLADPFECVSQVAALQQIGSDVAVELLVNSQDEIASTCVSMALSVRETVVKECQTKERSGTTE